MPTGAPDTRKTHVIRILGTNANKDVLSNMWADVERIDIAKNATQTLDGGWHGHQRKNRWMDDPSADDYNPDGNPARKTEILKLCSPDEADVNNPVKWIPIPVIKFMKSKGYDGDNNTGTQSQFHTGLDDDQDPTTRQIVACKVSHYDTNIDDVAQAAFDNDPTLTSYVVQGSDYQRDDTTKDDSQFVDTEVITYLKHKYNQTNTQDGGVNVGLQTKLLNQYLIDASDPADGTVIGANGINPPFRLDPWQNIINVKLRTLYLVVSVGASNQSFSTFSPAPLVSAPSFSAKGDQNQGVKLLDSQPTPNSANSFTNRPNLCFIYSSGYGSVEEAWTVARGPWSGPGPRPGGFGGFNPVDGACPWPGGGEPPDLTTVSPLEFESGNAPTAMYYLFEIPDGDGLVVVNVSGLVPNHDSEDIASASSVSTGGAATVIASVYSTIRGPVKKLSDIVDYLNDGKPRPDADDGSNLSVTNKNQGKFLINVHLDKNTADVQTDNYGNKFQPYKVTFNPGKDAVDQIPSQPPPLLPKP